MLTETNYHHYQAAHCESGATSNLLRNEGLAVSEAMSFGIGSGLFFIHVPFAKVMGIPLTSYRSFPGSIFKKCCKRLGIPYEYKSYSNPIKGLKALDEHLQQGRAIGLRGNIYWLPYIPEQFRFQFNAHHFVVYGKKENGDYSISDPILENVAECPSRALTKSRFSKGILAPKGLIFYPQKPLHNLDEKMGFAIKSGVRETVQRMLYTPLPFAGVRGIRYLAKQMQKWPHKLSSETHKLYVANVVRMLEEIGTGGAGFRFLQAAFFQEAGERIGNNQLKKAAKEMAEAGDLWRQFATLSAKFCKDRLDTSYEEIPKLLITIAESEKSVFESLRREYL